MDWYPRDVPAYRLDTRHLTTLEHGAYALLIDEYMITRQPLPDDDRALANIARMQLAEWLEIAPSIRAFFHPRSGLLTHKRCDRELDAQDDRSGKLTGKAVKAASRRWGSAEASGRHLRSQRLSAAREKGTHTALEWATLVQMCGGACLRCGADRDLVKDHILPIYQGGSDDIDNIQPLCRRCNSSKGPDASDLRKPEVIDWAMKRLPNACEMPRTKTKTKTRTEDKEGEESTKRAPRATRLPPDWTPPLDLIAFAEAEGLNQVQIRTTVDRFRDYWTAKAGASATKLDWSATFRNWIRKDIADGSRSHNGTRARPSPHRTLHDAAAELIGSGDEDFDFR